jgi:hypothetical protein
MEVFNWWISTVHCHLWCYVCVTSMMPNCMLQIHIHHLLLLCASAWDYPTQGEERHLTDHTKYDRRTHVWVKLRFTKFWSNKGTRILRVSCEYYKLRVGKGGTLKEAWPWLSSRSDRTQSPCSNTRNNEQLCPTKPTIHLSQQWMVWTDSVQQFEERRSDHHSISRFCLIHKYAMDMRTQSFAPMCGCMGLSYARRRKTQDWSYKLRYKDSRLDKTEIH